MIRRIVDKIFDNFMWICIVLAFAMLVRLALEPETQYKCVHGVLMFEQSKGVWTSHSSPRLCYVEEVE